MHDGKTTAAGTAPRPTGREAEMKWKRRLWRAGAVLCAAGMLLCGGICLHQWGEYRAGETAYDTLSSAVVSPPPEEQTAPGPAQEVTLPQVDFGALAAVNPSVVGWLYGPDTVLSYPVAQGEDNRYYLTHLFDGTENSAGSLFLDSRCPGLTGRNSVIYGHYMKNGTLFACLQEYQAQDYYEAHPNLYLLTPEGTVTIQLFSAYVTGAEGDAWQLTFPDREAYGTWLAGLQERSCFASAVTPTTADRVITLSTCDYSFSGARFVCHGLVREAAAEGAG